MSKIVKCSCMYCTQYTRSVQQIVLLLLLLDSDINTFYRSAPCPRKSWTQKDSIGSHFPFSKMSLQGTVSRDFRPRFDIKKLYLGLLSQTNRNGRNRDTVPLKEVCHEIFDLFCDSNPTGPLTNRLN